MIESANPKVQGFDGAAQSFVEYLAELATVALSKRRRLSRGGRDAGRGDGRWTSYDRGGIPTSASFSRRFLITWVTIRITPSRMNGDRRAPLAHDQSQKASMSR